jgi:lysylphosphatidylglycerol synthetase-like protein (DUF2156 family)
MMLWIGVGALVNPKEKVRFLVASQSVAVLSLMAMLAALLAAGLILVPAAFALRGATPLDWIAAMSGVGIGAPLTLLFDGNKEKSPAIA